MPHQNIMVSYHNHHKLVLTYICQIKLNQNDNGILGIMSLAIGRISEHLKLVIFLHQLLHIDIDGFPRPSKY